MPGQPIQSARKARRQMAHTHAARSPNDDGSRLRAATHERPSGRGRPTRIDPSTITSPTTRSRTQISPGVRGRIATTDPPPRNHSPPPRQGGPASDKSSWLARQREPDFSASGGGLYGVDRAADERARDLELVRSARKRRRLLESRDRVQRPGNRCYAGEGDFNLAAEARGGGARD